MNAIALSAAEMSELASCETVIEHGLKIFHAVGMALLTIREKRLYRADHTTFEAYCQAKWGFSDNYALRLMRGAEVVSNLTETLPIGRVLPANEAQVRPLLGLTPDQQREAWQEAVETAPNGKITGGHVEQVAQQYKPITSRRSGVNFSGEGAEPDLDEDGMPLVRRYEEEDDEDVIGIGDTVLHAGHTYTVRAAGAKVWLDVPSRHPLRSVGIDYDDIVLVERRSSTQTPPPAPPRIQGGEKAAPVAPGPTMEETAPHIDGVSIVETHPMGWQLFFIESSWATCVNCSESHPRWVPVRGGDWRCERMNCKQLTHDDLLIPYTKEDVVAEDRNARRNGNGQKPAPTADPLADDDTNDEWYTPDDIIAAVQEFLGGIDVDPASSDYAQRTVKARTYYTKRTDGLSRDWKGRVWLNPPYSYPLVERFTGELLSQYRRGIVEEAIVLVNNRTDAAWFQALLVEAVAVFVSGRINFKRPGVEASANRQGQVFFYLGQRNVEFATAFGGFGVVVRCVWSREAVQS